MCQSWTTCKVATELTFQLVAYRTQLLQIVWCVVVAIPVSVIHLCCALGPGGYAIKLGGTGKAQMPVVVATSACLVGSYPGPVCMTSIGCSLAVRTVYAISGNALLTAIAVGNWLIAPVIDADGSRLGVFDTHCCSPFVSCSSR